MLQLFPGGSVVKNPLFESRRLRESTMSLALLARPSTFPRAELDLVCTDGFALDASLVGLASREV